MSLSVFRLGLIQLAVSASKSQTVERACKLVREAVNAGAKVVVLPECFNCPYGTQYFADYAEKIPGETTQTMAKLASETKVYLVAGSIPEEEAGKLYNTCTVFDPNGNMVAKHRKIHLFDIDIPGGITFKESDVLSPGNTFTTFETEYCKIGVGICYDMRFAELAQIYNKQGCKLLLYPGAFNMTTGPVHWEIIQRARSVDNQIYTAAVSPARDETASYVAWGHSSVVNPWGDVIAKAGAAEEIIYADIDLTRLEQIRKQIPLTIQRRKDLYEVVAKT